MTSSRWDPSQYLRYGDERTRPFLDLLARVPGDARTVVDLGCGPGNDVEPLRARWPEAAIHGVDSSAEMIDRARADVADPRATFAVGDAAAWRPDGERPDVIVSNAMYQWVDRHIDLLPATADGAARAFAFQVPGNQDAPSHALLWRLAAEYGITALVDDVIAVADALGDALADRIELLGPRGAWWASASMLLLPPLAWEHDPGAGRAAAGMLLLLLLPQVDG